MTAFFDLKSEKQLLQLKCRSLKEGVGEFFEGDPYVTYRVPKCVSDD